MSSVFDLNQEMQLSLIYIDLANNFQSLTPYKQAEFLQLIQDEYADLLQFYDVNKAVEEYSFEEIERKVLYTLLYLFYEHTDSEHLTKKLERFIYKVLEEYPMSMEWLIVFGNTFQEYLNDVA